MSATSPDTGRLTREVSKAAASDAAAPRGSGPRHGGWAWPSPSSRRRSSWSCSTRPSSTSPCRTSRPRSVSRAPTWSGSSTRTRWRSAGCCCSAADPATYWGAAGSSSPGSCVFSLASLLGGFATSQEWLLTARVLQGVGGAFAAPTALSLIAVTFPEGPPRNRAMGVYAGDERRRRRGRPDRQRAAAHLPQLALGVLRQRADRPGGRSPRAARARRVRAAARSLRPAGRDHRLARPGRARLRAVQRRDHPERRVALG